MKEQILLFGINDHKDKLLLQQALLPLRIRLKTVVSEQYGKTIGELTISEPENDNHPSENTESIPAPMLVFCGLTSARLDAVLQAMRRKNIRIPHKAVLTPHNAAWTPTQLFEALEEERKQFESK